MREIIKTSPNSRSLHLHPRAVASTRECPRRHGCTTWTACGLRCEEKIPNALKPCSSRTYQGDANGSISTSRHPCSRLPTSSISARCYRLILLLVALAQSCANCSIMHGRLPRQLWVVLQRDLRSRRLRAALQRDLRSRRLRAALQRYLAKANALPY